MVVQRTISQRTTTKSTCAYENLLQWIVTVEVTCFTFSQQESLGIGIHYTKARIQAKFHCQQLILGLFVQTLIIVVLASIFLFYDNMCNLESLKIWDCDRNGLSLEARLGMSIFKRINKGVDGLHIRNHVRHSCKNEYLCVIQKLEKHSQVQTQSFSRANFLWLGNF